MAITCVKSHENILDWGLVKKKKQTATLENVRGLKPNHENINIGTAYGLGAAGNGKHLWFPYGCLLIKVLIQLYIPSSHI